MIFLESIGSRASLSALSTLTVLLEKYKYRNSKELRYLSFNRLLPLHS